jgi:hypothetical protein
MIENNSQENLTDSNENKSFNLVNDFYSPLLNSRNLYLDNTYKFLIENNTDPAEYLGVQKNPLSERIQYKSDNPELDKKNTEYSAKNFAQGFVNFMSDIPDEVVAKTVEGVLSTSKFGVNLVPFINKLIGSPINEDKIMQNSIEWSKSIDNTVNQYRRIYKDSTNAVKGRDPNSIAEFAGWAAQSYPYVVTTYQGLKKVGVPDVPAIVLSAGIGTAVSFDPKEASFTLNLFTQEIDSIKKYLEIIPDTPNNELFDRTLTLFENSFLAKYIPQIFEGAKFLKKYIPAFNEATPGAAVGVGGGTATGEIVDKTLLNPKDETIENQEPTILDNVRSGIDQFGNKLTEIGGAIKKEFSGEAMANPLVKKGATELAPVFKSAVVDAIEKIPNKAPGDQILGTIKNIPGVTQQEMKWIGLDDFLKGKPSVTKQEVSDFIQANRLDVNEVQFPKKATGEESKTVDELEKLLEPHTDYSSSAVYEYMNIKEALQNNLDVRYDTIPFTKKGSLRNSAEYPVKIGVNEFMDKAGLWDSIYETGEVESLGYFRKNFKNVYRIDSLRKNGQILDDDIIKNYYDEARSTDAINPNRNFEYYDDADFSRIIFSEEEFIGFKNYLKSQNVGINEYTTLKMSDDFVDKIYNEYVIRASNENLEKFNIDFDFIQSIDGGGSKTKFGQYTLPGGRDYKELVFTLSKGGKNVGFDFPLEQGATKSQTARELGIPTTKHMNVMGEFAHVRFKTRNINGQKTLSVEEMQSDLFQSVKQKNKSVMRSADELKQSAEANPNGLPTLEQAKLFADNNLIKDFPFKSNWYELATRRLVRYAADNGFDAIAIPEGRVAAARYGKVGGFVDNVEIKVGLSDKNNEAGYPTYTFYLTQKNGKKVVEERAFSDAGIYGIDKIYPKNYQDILSDAEDILLHKYTRQELKDKTFSYKLSEKQFIGEGKGKFELYDQAIPSYIKKYAKKWNAPVTKEAVKFPEENDTVDYIVLKLTPEMKRSVQEKSQPLFNIVLPALSAGGGAKVISDNMENNTISNPTKN